MSLKIGDSMKVHKLLYFHICNNFKEINKLINYEKYLSHLYELEASTYCEHLIFAPHKNNS